MKKVIVTLLLTASIASLCACGATCTPVTASKLPQLNSTGEVTLEEILSRTTPSELLKYLDTFAYTSTYSETGDPLLEGSTQEMVFNKSGDLLEISQTSTYSDGYVSSTYFSNDANDPNYYIGYPGGSDSYPLPEDEMSDVTGHSMMSLSDSASVVTEVKEENGCYIATVETTENGVTVTDLVTIDAATGRVVSIVSTYPSSVTDGDTTCTTVFDYSGETAINREAKESASEAATKAEEGSNAAAEAVETVTEAEERSDAVAGAAETVNASESAEPAVSSEKVTSILGENALDINGNPVSGEALQNAKLILMNFWEPWCKPCVGELPDLQALYEKYKDQGLVILGVYSAFDMQEDAEAIVEQKAISYPIVKCNEYLQTLQKDYFPATYLMDGEGNLLSEDPIIGANDYDGWEKVIQENLK